MSLGVLENKILHYIDNEEIDILKIRELFDKGANPNALENDKPDKGFNDDIYYSTFFSECIFVAQEKAINLYELLKVFIEYGLDLEKYGSSIISDFHYISESNDIYEMTKLILNSTKNKIDVGEAISGIGVEASYINCCLDEIENRDELSNYLFGLAVLLELYKENKPYNGVYSINKNINQKFINMKIKGDFVEVNNKKISVKSEKDRCSMLTNIQMEKDFLIVEDNYGVYINNQDMNEYNENVFTKNVNEYLKDEKIVEIKFKHYDVRIKPKVCKQGRVVTIEFTNGKKLVFEEDVINGLEIIELK